MPRQRKSFTDLFSEGQQSVRATSRSVENSALRELQLEAALLDMDEQKKKPNLLQRKAFADYVNADVELTPKIIGLVFGAGPKFLAAAQSSRVSALQDKRDRRREAVRIRLDELALKEAEARALNRGGKDSATQARALAFRKRVDRITEQLVRGVGHVPFNPKDKKTLGLTGFSPEIVGARNAIGSQVTDSAFDPDTGKIEFLTDEDIIERVVKFSRAGGVTGIFTPPDVTADQEDRALAETGSERAGEAIREAAGGALKEGLGVLPVLRFIRGLATGPGDRGEELEQQQPQDQPPPAAAPPAAPPEPDKPKDVPFVPLGPVAAPGDTATAQPEPATATPDTVATKPAAAAKPAKPTGLSKQEQFELLKKARRRKGSKLTKADVLKALGGN